MTPPFGTRPGRTKYHHHYSQEAEVAQAAHSHDIGWYCDCGGWIRATTATPELGATRLPHFYHYQEKARDVKAQSALRRVVRDGLRIEHQVSAL